MKIFFAYISLKSSTGTMNPLIMLNNVVSILSVLVIGGYGVVVFTDRMLRKKAQAQYELSFIERHRDSFVNETPDDGEWTK